jgi:hypothetical protein
MAPRKKVIAEFVEQDEALYVQDLPEAEVLEATTRTDQISARVKGSWTMFWGQTSWNFQDGQRYKLPRDLFEYLKSSGNIYDTL